MANPLTQEELTLLKELTVIPPRTSELERDIPVKELDQSSEQNISESERQSKEPNALNGQSLPDKEMPSTSSQTYSSLMKSREKTCRGIISLPTVRLSEQAISESEMPSTSQTCRRAYKPRNIFSVSMPSSEPDAFDEESSSEEEITSKSSQASLRKSRRRNCRRRILVSNGTTHLHDHQFGTGRVTKIGFIGSGDVASSVLQCLLKSGNEISVWITTAEEMASNELPSKDLVSADCAAAGKHGEFVLFPLRKYGEYIEKSEAEDGKAEPDIHVYKFSLLPAPSLLVRSSTIIISCFDSKESLDTALHGVRGVLKAPLISKGYIEMSAVDTDFCVLVSEEIKQKGGKYLEVAFMPSKSAVRRKNVILFTAGCIELFKQSQHLFGNWASYMFYHGEKVGFAANVNMIHQLMLGVLTANLAENLSFAKRLGIDHKTILTLLRVIEVASSNDAERGQVMSDVPNSGNSYPDDFPVDHMWNLMKLVTTDSKFDRYNMSLLPSVVHQYYTRARSFGFKQADISCIYECGPYQLNTKEKEQNISILEIRESL